MSTPAPGISLPHRIRQDPYAPAPETRFPVPTFTPHPAPPVLQMPAFPPAGFATGPQALQRIRDAMTAQGWEAHSPAAPLRRAGTGEHLPIFDAVAAGTGPQPVMTLPEPARTPAFADPGTGSTWLPGFFQALLLDAAEGAGRRIFEPCRCALPHMGWCPGWEDALARSARYSRLAALIDLAETDRDAVSALLAQEWRDDGADTWTRTEERAL